MLLMLRQKAPSYSLYLTSYIMKILSFMFKSNDGILLSFITPADAIKYFTSKGYGMHNWSITVQFDDIYESISSISLLVFNYITDNWE